MGSRPRKKAKSAAIIVVLSLSQQDDGGSSPPSSPTVQARKQPTVRCSVNDMPRDEGYPLRSYSSRLRGPVSRKSRPDSNPDSQQAVEGSSATTAPRSPIIRRLSFPRQPNHPNRRKRHHPIDAVASQKARNHRRGRPAFFAEHKGTRVQERVKR